MITKTKFWKFVRQELKEVQRSKDFTKEIMKRVKEIPQHEDNDQRT